MRHIRIIVCLLSLFLVACEGTTFQSSVPAYPVRVVIDTKQGAFVHFQPTATGSYITIDRDGYYMNGSFVLPLGVTDMYGYGGIVDDRLQREQMGRLESAERGLVGEQQEAAGCGRDIQRIAV